MSEELDVDTKTAPAIELDFGIGRIYVQGDSDTSFEEVIAEFNEQKDEMVDTIEQLKKFDYELKDEYDDVSTGASFS